MTTCAFPGCFRAISDHSSTGVCRAHVHTDPCRCRQCRGEVNADYRHRSEAVRRAGDLAEALYRDGRQGHAIAIRALIRERDDLADQLTEVRSDLRQARQRKAQA